MSTKVNTTPLTDQDMEAIVEFASGQSLVIFREGDWDRIRAALEAAGIADQLDDIEMMPAELDV